MQFIRAGATHKVVLGPAVAVGDGFTPVTTLALSTADEAEAILHDNGTVVDIAAYTWAAIATADGYYHLTLQSGISGTVGHMKVVVNDDSLCLPIKADFTVLTASAYDFLFASTSDLTGFNRGLATIGYGTVGTGSTTLNIVTSALTPTAGVAQQLINRVVTFTNATTTANLRGASAFIVGITTGGEIAVTPPLPASPVSGDLFVIN